MNDISGYNIWKLDLPTPRNPELKSWTGKGYILPKGRNTTHFLSWNDEMNISKDRGFLTVKNPLVMVTGGYWGKSSIGPAAPFGSILTRSTPKRTIIEGQHGYRSSAIQIDEIFSKDDPCSLCLERKGKKVFPNRGKYLLLCNKCYNLANKASKKGLDLPSVESVYSNLGMGYGVPVTNAKYHPMLEGRVGGPYKD